MDIITEVEWNGANVIEEFARVSRKSFQAALLQAGRGAIRHVISITPPASASGIARGLDSGSEAKRRGYGAIARDLGKVFVPVKIKGQRRERISGAELVAIHRRHLGYKRPGAPMRRYGGPFFVDRRKLDHLQTKLQSHVGRLAAGWLPAAQALGVATPQWVSRHGLGRGSFRADLGGDEMILESVNLASPFAPVAELRRRVPYAVDYAMNDLRRQITFLTARNARASGFLVPFAPA